MAVDLKPFESDFGFKSPGFTVDDEGNVVVKSLSYLEDENGNVNLEQDYGVGNAGTQFVLSDGLGNPLTGQNPSITLERGQSYIFELTLTGTLTFNIINAAGDALYNTGVSHTTADNTETTGADAQGKQTGFFTFVVPINAPDTLYYGDLNAGTLGTINIEFPTITGIGQFSELVVSGNSSLGPTEIIDTTESLSLSSGALIVAGGAAVKKDLNVGGDLIANQIKTNGTGYAVFETQTNLGFNVGNRIDVIVGDTLIGNITAEGSALKISGTTIDDTVIGGTTPSSASFTDATVSKTASLPNDITNKTYVDLNSAAFAIALGT